MFVACGIWCLAKQKIARYQEVAFERIQTRAVSFACMYRGWYSPVTWTVLSYEAENSSFPAVLTASPVTVPR